jgi:hypothetical protein
VGGTIKENSSCEKSNVVASQKFYERATGTYQECQSETCQPLTQKIVIV